MVGYLKRKIFGRRTRATGRPVVIESFNHDGLAIAKRKTHARGLPMRHLALFLIAAMSLRMVTYSDLGPAGYAARMSALLEGGTIERMAGRAMALDTVSENLAQGFRRVSRSLGM